MILLFVIRLMLLTARFGFLLAIVIDFIILGGVGVFYGHTKLFPLIASGNAIIFWDVVLFVIILFIYSFIVNLGTMKFPRVSLIFHYLMAWIGTAVLYLLMTIIIFQGLPRLLKIEWMSDVTHIIIVSLLSLILYSMRLKMFQKEVY